MTVSSTISRSGPYNGNGVTTVFDYDFRILEASHLTVVRTINGEDSVVNPSDYSVSGVGAANGGTIQFTVPPAPGEAITIIRNMPFTQEIDLENQGPYYAETVERALDAAAMRDQQLEERLDRAVTVPVGANPSVLPTLIEDIIRLGDSVDNIDTVANHIGAVDAVAPHAATLAANVGDIITVADNIGDVRTVSTNIASVNAVAPHAATLAGNIGDIVTVADSISDVETVSANIASVNELAPLAQTITDNLTDITNFADVYQGPKPADPTKRNDGTALQAGDLYFNTTSKSLRVYTGEGWLTIDKEVPDGSITSAKLGDGAVTGAKIGAGAVTDEKVAANAGIQASKLAYVVGGNSRSVASRLADFVSVLDYIPPNLHDSIRAGTNTTLLQGYIQAAINAAPWVYFPPGTYLVGNAGNNVALTLNNGNTLCGAGDFRSILKLADGGNANIVNIPDGRAGITIQDLQFDGNRLNQSVGVHCIRIGGLLRGRFERLRISNAYHYGIGVQTGTNRSLYFNSLYFSGCGGDAIDIKNLNDANRAIFLDNIHVESFGLNPGLESNQAAIDLRGPCEVSNVQVEGVTGDLVGIRFRFGDTGDASGLGAHQSHLSNFRISGSGANTTGLEMGARHVKVTNGHIGGVGVGVVIFGEFCAISNVTAEASGHCFRLHSAGSGLYWSHYTTVSECVALGAVYGFNVSANVNDVTISNCTARNNGTGIYINAGATRTQLLYNNCRNNTTAALTNNGTDTINVGTKV